MSSFLELLIAIWKTCRMHWRWFTSSIDVGRFTNRTHGNAMKLYWKAIGMMSLLKAPKLVQVLCRILANFCAMCSWHGNMLSVGKTVGQLAMPWISKQQKTNNTIVSPTWEQYICITSQSEAPLSLRALGWKGCLQLFSKSSFGGVWCWSVMYLLYWDSSATKSDMLCGY